MPSRIAMPMRLRSTIALLAACLTLLTGATAAYAQQPQRQRNLFEMFWQMPAQPQLRSCLLDLDEEGRELVVLRQFDEYAEAQPADSRAAAASWQRSLLVVDG